MLLHDESLQFQILTVSRARHPAGSFRVKARPYGALSLRMRGGGRFDIGGKQFVSDPGDLLYIPAHVPYEAEYSVSEMLVVHFSYCSATEPQWLRVQNRAAVEAAFLRLLDSWEQKRSQYEAKSRLYGLLALLSDERVPAEEHSALIRCVDYMTKHMAEPDLNVERVCRELYVSRSTLQRVFGRQFGLSPQRYLTKLRMERALELLADGSHTVRDTAMACGFSDEKYFSTVFKSTYGFSPSHWKQGAST